MEQQCPDCGQVSEPIWCEAHPDCPKCPACGDPVDVSPVVMGGLAAVDLYMPGSVTCLNGCQPPR